jgi:hypothetical protein
MYFKSTAVRFALLSLLTSAVATTAHSQTTTLADWTFDNITTKTITSNPAPTSGSGTATSLGMTNSYSGTTAVTTDDIDLGTTSDTGANGLADTTNTWRVRGQSPGNGWSSQAAIGTQGAQFGVNTTGYQNITVSFDWYATTQGEANLQLQYTDNGTTWTNVAINIGANASAGLASLTNTNAADINTVQGSYISDNLLNNGSQAGQDWFQDLTATISDPAAANDPNFGFRLVNASTGSDNVSTQGTALNNTSGNWRFDNVEITGTAISPVPEPASGTMMLLGLCGLAGFASLARRKG